MTYLRRILLVLLLGSLVGCSQKFQDVNATLNEAIFGFNDVNMTAAQVAELEYASIYARINHGAKIFMVLALVDTNPVTGNPQLKWSSSDGAIITTENGRIVKTTALPEANLVNIQASNNLAAPNSQVKTWQAQYDWQPGYHFSESAQIESFPVGINTTSSLLWIKPTTQVREIISFNGHQTMQSDYWVDKNGNVVKSAQSLIPEQLFIEIEVLKPFAG
ncbi:hypothetical protein BIY21_17290 [Vibrio ponticus]|uniref:YjbF family lipoprotein n=1 Tax=Vibrio ponticus TaxID=265668 RepID=A0ABX3FBW6_9VIBR|nr:YjbF family lipoprotein [Vibrio ponticus]OLQ87311.1 hypothetical protein BIY21_17290 [Vibrio ponticus]